MNTDSSQPLVGPRSPGRAALAEAAIRDRLVAVEMTQHKKDYWRAMDADGQPINYGQVIHGALQFVPNATARQALGADHKSTTES